jgi:methylated-DNA-[protein]-cysteine S-methyltransferase
MGRQPRPEGTTSCAFATPAGPVRLAFLGARLVGVALGEGGAPDLAALPPACREIAFALQAFLNGRRPILPALPFLLTRGTSFHQRVWLALPAIPPGTTATYGEVAALLGLPRGARAVGQAVGRNPLPVVLPCHRVVAKGGPGGFGAGLAWKGFLLAREGGTLPGSP